MHFMNILAYAKPMPVSLEINYTTCRREDTKLDLLMIVITCSWPRRTVDCHEYSYFMDYFTPRNINYYPNQQTPQAVFV